MTSDRARPAAATERRTEAHASERAARLRDRYLERAIDLRNCVAQNQDDDRFVEKRRGQIRYVFDANVVRFYLNPFSKDELARVALFGHDDLDDARALAVVTAEFLFSGDLCGQWNLRPLISRWHAMELESHVRHLGDRWRRRLEEPQSEGGDDTPGHFDGLMHLINGGHGSIAELRRKILRMESPLAGIGEIMAGEDFEARQFALMMQQRLLRPLHLDPVAARSPVILDEAEAARLAKRKAAWRAEPGSRHSDERDLADARTLLAVDHLNVAAAKLQPSEPVRYVLVTTDRALFNCALEEFDRRRRMGLERAGDPFDVPVRRLPQFVPYLNTRQIPNHVDSSALVGEVQTAIESFLITNRVAQGPLPRILPRAVHEARHAEDGPMADLLRPTQEAREGAAYTKLYEEALDRVSHLWAQLGRESVLLNSALIGRRVERFLSLSAALEEADDVRHALHRLMLDTVSQVERGHLVLGVEHYLSGEIADFVGKGDEEPRRRGVLVLRSTFAELTGMSSLTGFLEALVRDAKSLDYATVLERITTMEDEDAYLFCACVAFWGSRWDTAALFAERAVAKRRRRVEDEWEDPRILEMRYVALASRRFEAMDAELDLAGRIARFEELRDEGEDLLLRAKATADPFERCRAELELAMIELSQVYLESMRGEEGAVNWIDARADEAFDRLKAIVALLRQISGGCPRAAFDLLVTELAVATTGFMLHRAFVSRRDHRAMLRAHEGLMRQFSEVMNRPDVARPDIYRNASDFIDVILTGARASSDREVRAEARRHLRDALKGAFRRTRMDEETTSFLIKAI